MQPKVSDKAIMGFFGEYRWLSNFWPVDIYCESESTGLYKFSTTEAAYQAYKSLDPEDWLKFSDLSTAAEAKRLGNKIRLRPDWDIIKYKVMLDITRKKFQYEYLAKNLLSTGDRYLEETNNWGDTYWGVCNGTGLNKLGEILMKVRNELR